MIWYWSELFVSRGFRILYNFGLLSHSQFVFLFLRSLVLSFHYKPIPTFYFYFLPTNFYTISHLLRCFLIYISLDFSFTKKGNRSKIKKWKASLIPYIIYFCLDVNILYKLFNLKHLKFVNSNKKLIDSCNFYHIFQLWTQKYHI